LTDARFDLSQALRQVDPLSAPSRRLSQALPASVFLNSESV
jgi:hypothetical protein